MDRRQLKNEAKQSVRGARGSTKLTTLVCLLAVALLALAEWGLTLLVEHTAGESHYLSQALSAQSRSYALLVLVSLVFQLLLILLFAGYYSFALRISRNESFSMGVLLDGFRIWQKPVLLYLYISVLQALWSIVFSMPASYVLTALFLSDAISESVMLTLLMGYVSLVMFIVSYRYRMAWFVLLDGPEKSIRQIIGEAKAINQTHRWQLFVLDLSFLPWLLLCGLTCGVLLIWKLPYIAATYAHVYRHMLDDYAIRQQRMEELLAEQQERFRQNRFF
ncbi:MAG: DUF975 family protein [Oscillospiraceae bacterium]|nr:DUF975 family protein [Oscillospiraceae bacterium]